MTSTAADRAISPDDLAELTAAIRAFEKARRRYNAVSARIADAYDVEAHEMVDPSSGRIVPTPQDARG